MVKLALSGVVTLLSLTTVIPESASVPSASAISISTVRIPLGIKWEVIEAEFWANSVKDGVNQVDRSRDTSIVVDTKRESSEVTALAVRPIIFLYALKRREGEVGMIWRPTQHMVGDLTRFADRGMFCLIRQFDI